MQTGLAKRKKIAVAKCAALDWLVKSEQIVTCISRVIWHVQIRAELS